MCNVRVYNREVREEWWFGLTLMTEKMEEVGKGKSHHRKNYLAMFSSHYLVCKSLNG